jgi:hypothetical protein
MAIAPQGGLSQASAQPPAGGGKAPAFDADTVAAENIETQKKETPAQDYATRALEERREQSKLLNLQIEMLKANLQSRMNPPFDPMLMRVSAGFGKPTKTGSFGESLGYASEGAADEAEKQIARNAMTDKMHLELSEKQMGLAKQNASMENLLRLSGMPAGGGAPMGGAAPVGGPAVGPANRPPVGGAPVSAGASPAGGAPVVTPAGGAAKSPGVNEDIRQIRQITDADIAFSYAISKEDGEMVANLAKVQREDVIDTKYGPFSRSQRKYLEVDPYVTQTTERGVPYLGKQTVTQKQSREIDQMIAQSEKLTPEQTEDMFGRYYAMQGIGEVKRTKGAPAGGAGAPPAGSPPSGAGSSVPAAPSAGSAPSAGGVSGMKNPSELADEKFRREKEVERQQAEALERTKGDIADNKELKSGIYSSGRAANGTVLTADAIYRLATDPNTKGAFGVLQDANVQSAILGAIAEGVQTPGGSFKFAGIEDAVRKIGGTDKEINAALQASRYYAELELQYARTYLKGQGAVSDNERKIVSRLGGSLSDTPSVAAAKAETIKARADFDKRKSDLLYKWEQKNPNGYVKDFERSPEYLRLEGFFNDYMGKLNDKYFAGNTAPAAPATNAPAATAPATPAPAAPKPVSVPTAPATAPTAPKPKGQPIEVSGKEDPKYKSLEPGDLFIWKGTVYTK